MYVSVCFDAPPYQFSWHEAPPEMFTSVAAMSLPVFTHASSARLSPVMRAHARSPW